MEPSSTIETAPEAPLPLWQPLKRGFAGRCPQCGTGKLFRSYLKQVDACADCAEPYNHIRADDGPAWLTILLTGHLFAFSMIFIGPSGTEPDWLGLGVVLLILTAITLLFLPRAKGFFIAFIWRIQMNRTQSALSDPDQPNDPA